MSDILTKVNQIGLNTDFPIAGQNNSTAGFRQNARATAAGFQQASDELTKFQNTRFNFTGDATGRSDRITNAQVTNAADPTLDIAFTLSNTLPQETNTSTKAQDFDLKIDRKGRVIQVTPTTHDISWNVGSPGQDIAVQGSSMGSGTGTVNFPTLRFNALGRLIGTDYHPVSFGLGGQKLTAGSILMGDGSNVSKEFAPPTASGAYALVANGAVLSWQPVGAGAVTGVVGGLGIKVLADPAAPTVSLDITNTSASNDLRDQDLIPWHDLRDNLPKNTTLANLRSLIVRFNSDTSPTLGGDLDIKNFAIKSSTGPVLLKSSPNGVTEASILLNSDIALNGKAVGITGTSFALQSGPISMVGTTYNLRGTSLVFQGNSDSPITLSGGPLVLAGSSLEFRGSNTSPVSINGGSIGLTGTSLTVQSGPINIKGTALQVQSSSAELLADNAINIRGGSLRLNNTLWPTIPGRPGEYLVMGSGGLVWYAEEEVPAQTLAQTVFVGPDGDDSAGNGAFTNPYKSIMRAVNSIPTGQNTHWTVVLLGNTYNEDVVVQNIRKVSIESFFKASRTKITGSIQVGFNVDEFNMTNINWDLGARVQDTGPVLTVTSGLVTGTIRNCGFIKNNRQQNAVGLYGPTTGRFQLLDCDIYGLVVNQMTLSDDGQVIISSLVDKLDNNIPIVNVDTNRDLELNDVGKYLRVNVSTENEIRVPDSTIVEFNLGATIRIAQTGIGSTSILPTQNVTINTPNGYALRRRYSRAELVYVGNNIWDLSGDLDESIIIAPVMRVDSDQISVDSDTITVDNG